TRLSTRLCLYTVSDETRGGAPFPSMLSWSTSMLSSSLKTSSQRLSTERESLSHASCRSSSHGRLTAESADPSLFIIAILPPCVSALPPAARGSHPAFPPRARSPSAAP